MCARTRSPFIHMNFFLVWLQTNVYSLHRNHGRIKPLENLVLEQCQMSARSQQDIWQDDSLDAGDDDDLVAVIRDVLPPNE